VLKWLTDGLPLLEQARCHDTDSLGGVRLVEKSLLACCCDTKKLVLPCSSQLDARMWSA